jgi:hypothetical protein
MTIAARNHRIEYGDFQTPDILAHAVCARLSDMGISPNVIIEPTCGMGAFLLAAAQDFPEAQQLFGFEINPNYLDALRCRINNPSIFKRIQLQQADFFATDWKTIFDKIPGKLLIIGNPPWVTNTGQSVIGGNNLPKKTNFLGQNGFDAISGKANFDISEWILLNILRHLQGRTADVAMLVKTSVARKVLAYAEQQRTAIYDAFISAIDAKKHFDVAVDACLLVIRIDTAATPCGDYTIYDSLESKSGKRVGHRYGMTIANLEAFEHYSFLFGNSPQKWRSGIKHDASSIMELTRAVESYKNGLGEIIQLENSYLYPLLKGSDIANGRKWHNKYVLVTQRNVGEPTEIIQQRAPLTWHYLQSHAVRLDSRSSTIYKKNPRFSIFGVGDYAFRPWRIAICSLYKTLQFRLIPPINGRPVMFDDTVYYLSFDTENEATEILTHLQSKSAMGLLSSMIFWDEKRPIKAGILNTLDWSNLTHNLSVQINTEQLALV